MAEIDHHEAALVKQADERCNLEVYGKKCGTLKVRAPGPLHPGATICPHCDTVPASRR